MKIFKLLCLALLIFSVPLNAEEKQDFRGGWITDIDGVRHIYYIVMRNDSVSGFYCTDCSNPANLALIDDGVLDATGLSFTLYHYRVNAEPYRERIHAALSGSELIISGQAESSSDAAVQTVFHRVNRETYVLTPMADRSPNAPAGGQKTRILPAPAVQITADKVTGLWLWGSGPGKQHFIFLQHGDEVRGMVCGPCDSVIDMAPLEGIRMEGDNFHFEIVHEDNGGDIARYGPFSNMTNARIARNEMHMNVVASYAPAGTAPVEMTLLGPVALKP